MRYKYHFGFFNVEITAEVSGYDHSTFNSVPTACVVRIIAQKGHQVMRIELLSFQTQAAGGLQCKLRAQQSKSLHSMNQSQPIKRRHSEKAFLGGQGDKTRDMEFFSHKQQTRSRLVQAVKTSSKKTSISLKSIKMYISIRNVDLQF